MGKRQPSLHPAQLAFSFDLEAEAHRQGSFAEADRMIAAGVSRILKEDPRTRFEIAADMSELLDSDVSKWMLDAWSSEARDGHNVSFSRMVLLAAITGRADVLNALMRPFGFAVLVGEEIYLAEIGHLEAKRRAIDTRLRALKAEAQPMRREGSHK